MALYWRNSLVYDDVLDITWLQDANYPKTSGYAAANATGSQNSSTTSILTSGEMGWDAAQTWVSNLSYKGITGWRLPSANLMNPTNPCSSYSGSCDRGSNVTTSEMGHMFFNNLGNLAWHDTNGNQRQSGWGLTNTSFTDANSGASVSFANMQSITYWYDETYAPYPNNAWDFYPGIGHQYFSSKVNSNYCWAVHDGNLLSDISLDHIHQRTGAASGTECSINDSNIRALAGQPSGSNLTFTEWY